MATKTTSTKDNLAIYNQLANVPQEAQRTIKGGRLSGFTDINPMWRIKVLTEQFGMCGFGWKYTIDNQWLERTEKGEIKAFVNISLYIKVDNQWSDAIPGTGGSSFISLERGGLTPSDECYKMALTDAISVASKALGVGADIYWSAGRTKYCATTETPAQQNVTTQQTQTPPPPASSKPLLSRTLPEGISNEDYCAVIDNLNRCRSRQEVSQIYNSATKLHTYAPFMEAMKKVCAKFPRK